MSKIGPFLCEWCDSPMLDIKGIRLLEDGKTVGVGTCSKCGTTVWSKSIVTPSDLSVSAPPAVEVKVDPC